MFLLLPLVFAAAPVAEPDPVLPYSAARSDAVTYDIDFRAIVTAPQGTKKLRVWLPVPQSDRGQEVKPGRFVTFPQDVKPALGTEPEFGNIFAYFEFDNPQGAQIIEHRFSATVHELRWNVDAEKVLRIEKWPASFDRYRRGERK